MDNEKLLERIDSALRHAGADGDFDAVLKALESDTSKGKIINMNEAPKKNTKIIPIAIAAALALAILGGAVGYFIGHGSPATENPTPIVTPAPVESTAPVGEVDSVITLDVNPSIEIDVDANDTVTRVTPLNSDARIVVGSMDFAGSGLDVTVNALIGSMLTNGYLDDLRNSILVSVTNGDSARASALQQSVSGMIESALGTGGLQGAVVSQTLTPDESLSSLAVSYNITEGKAALIKKVVAADPTLTVESLVNLPINDIVLIASSRQLTDNTVTQTGTASSGAYIGTQAALEAACAHAGLDVNSLVGSHVDFDSENGRMVYEVDIYTSDAEYEYDIDASTGAVVKYEREQYSNPGGIVSVPSAPAASDFIGETAAKSAALSHAGVSSSGTTWIKAQFERDDGRYIYELEFVSGGAKYEYDIDATSGAVIKFESEQYNGGQQGSWGNQTGGAMIGEAAAKSAALSHAGVSESEAGYMRVELDRDDGYTIYEVDFRVGWMEYEYKIDAYTGTILQAERDYDD